MASSKSKFNHTKEINNIGLTASALQDHLVKYCNFNDSVKKKQYSGQKKRDDKKDRNTESFLPKSGNKEFVIRSKNLKELSLAEKLGIVNSPAINQLSEKQWISLKEVCYQRNELSEPCSICKELYTHAKQQVLLSCSHVFHRQCISSFEKFSGRKLCPICRYKNYEKRVICDGARITAQDCATKIQSHWRRFVEQKRYRILRKTIPPKDKLLRKEFYKNKLLGICDEVCKSYNEHENDVSLLISNIDQNIASSRSVMQKFDDSFMSEVEWGNIKDEAVKRDTSDCPICLANLKQLRKRTVLLSCSHLFHDQCLSAYEKFANSLSHVCPICRKSYSKRLSAL